MRRILSHPAVKIAVRLAATALLAAILLSRVRLDTLAETLRSVEWRWWATGLAVSLVVQGFGGMRWAKLAQPLGFDHSTLSYILRFFEGSFFSLCLPTSIGGDVVKAYRLSDTSQGRLLAGCTVIADRLTGLSALGVLAGTTILGRSLEMRPEVMIGTGAILLAATAGLFMLAVRSIDRMIDAIPSHHAARSFLAQLLPYQARPRLMANAVFYSMVVQVGGVIAVALIARALGLAVPLDVWFYVVPLVALATVLPISISGVGIREGGLAFLLKPHGVSEEQAVALGLLWFLTGIVAGLLGGVIFLFDAGRHPAISPRPAQADPSA